MNAQRIEQKSEQRMEIIRNGIQEIVDNYFPFLKKDINSFSNYLVIQGKGGSFNDLKLFLSTKPKIEEQFLNMLLDQNILEREVAICCPNCSDEILSRWIPEEMFFLNSEAILKGMDYYCLDCRVDVSSYHLSKFDEAPKVYRYRVLV